MNWSLLNQDGQVLLDSSNVEYLMDSAGSDNYYGEVEFCYEYEGRKGQPFPWLYLDEELLILKASQCQCHCQIVYNNPEDHFLAVLKPYTYE